MDSGRAVAARRRLGGEVPGARSAPAGFASGQRGAEACERRTRPLRAAGEVKTGHSKREDGGTVPLGCGVFSFLLVLTEIDEQLLLEVCDPICRKEIIFHCIFNISLNGACGVYHTAP